jgi:acyl CoA:acetate/3-ketoacid CoA transferase alpha subunit
MIGGFGTAGQPAELIDGLIELGSKTLSSSITMQVMVTMVLPNS